VFAPALRADVRVFAITDLRLPSVEQDHRARDHLIGANVGAHLARSPGDAHPDVLYMTL
jgi:hypothetical protein